MLEEFVPLRHWEIFWERAKTGDEVVFECADASFSGVSPDVSLPVIAALDLLDDHHRASP